MNNPRVFFKITQLLFVCLFIACSNSDEITEYELTTSINNNEGGEISPSGGTYESGESISLTAIPSEGYIFVEWSGEASGSSNPLQITITDDTQISASFRKADADNDGVDDDVDNCPDTAPGTTVNANGCEDTTNDAGGEVGDEDDDSDIEADADGDGVTDENDSCENTPQGETVDETGCSDSQKDDDGDGVNNDLDDCDDTPSGETVNASGCSSSQTDTDNDGVFDDVDTCPDTPDGESVDDAGCSDSQKDTDNDGINDAIDNCDNTPEGTEVDEEGCEVIARTFIPNDEFEQYLIDLGLDDVLDDYVDTANIENLESLEFGEPFAIDDQVDDLTGVEDFISLKSITLYSQTIDELNFIAHPTLEEINFDQCRVENFNISNNPNLISVRIHNGSSVGNLILSGNPAVERLSIFDGGWTTALISSNPRLTSIANDDNHFGGTTRIVNNQSLTEIVWTNGSFIDTTLEDNPNLTSVTIFFVATRTLDISQNPSITSLELGETTFESLDLSNNNIVDFNISHDPNFRVNHEPLTCIKVNQEQLENIPSTWTKEDSMIYALECE